MRVALEKIVQHGRQVLQNFTNRGAEKIGWRGKEFARFQPEQQPKVFPRQDALLATKVGKHDTSVLFRYLARSNLKSVAADLRRRSAWEFMAGNIARRRPTLPIYAFVGFALAAKSQVGEEGQDSICSEIRRLFNAKATPPREGEIVDHSTGFTLDDYEFGEMIAKGCNAAVYEARLKTEDVCLSDLETEDDEEEDIAEGLNIISQMVLEEEEDDEEYDVISDIMMEEDEENFEMVFEENHEIDTSSGISSLEHYNLAVKMMFNYDTSDAQDIMRTMEKEAVPAKMAAMQGSMLQWENGNRVKKKKRVPPHPNIVDMQQVFIGEVPGLPQGMEEYPLALPCTLNPDGCGRTQTMFLVMKRYNTTLRDFLKNHTLSVEGATLLLLQLIEGLVHIGHHKVAHRDLKTDNILLDTFQGETPQLVVCDFGCCLAEEEFGLKLPFPTYEINRGGNGSLMAPEITTAVPGPASYLDYRKTDLWAAGAIAYEIYGAENPFYRNASPRRLDSSTYRERDLQGLPEHVPRVLERIVHLMLIRDPAKRPGPTVIANLLHLLLWAPEKWRHFLPTFKDITDWLLHLVAEVKCQKLRSNLGEGQRSQVNNVENQLKELFLARVDLLELLQDVWSLFYLSNKV